MSETTYLFVNTNEFLELPRPLTHKIIYVGGTSVSKSKKVDEVGGWFLSYIDKNCKKL